MARRSNRRSSQSKTIKKVASKPRSTETLEPRVVMSANPISGPMFGTHSIVDDMPAMTQHQAPVLEQHSVAPILEQTGLESTAGHDPDADFWLGAGSSIDLLEDLDRQIEQNLREGHALTGQDDVVDTYGFKGTGQTVAVIDSGIAYNHFALGGGMGSGYRVVGGWDFTENDADFYDDGPSKSAAHGTHVAGIVGAAGGGTHQGVATDVDLVGLRVFDDAGNGYFSWVEQALQWVHTNRNAFDNPITAVNLSLGIEQNATSVPGWSMLEDEFAQLEADGIFISVSAGNSFANYNAKGLSYPASSPHVIPVMASSNDGTLAPFSQRHESAIAAPGRWITSTVPDYAANDGDTIDDDYLSMSGTSMAAPYVAGASVLIREAMEFARQDANHTDSWGDIDQWDIYHHMIDTAVTFHDSATSTDFKRLDLKAAIDAIIPEDDFGSTIATAHNLGTLDETASSPLSMLSGSITTLDDADHFSFTAGVTGVVTISAANASHAMTASWEAWGGTWSINEAGDCVLEVVAGQSYRVGLSSSDGLGYYDLGVNVESTFAGIEWGAVHGQETRSGLTSTGEQWHQVTASRTGYLTVQMLNSDAAFEIRDTDENLLASGTQRIDWQAQEGETLLVRVSEAASDYGLRITNALTVSGGVVTLGGSEGQDTFSFVSGTSNHLLSLNGVSYSISAAGTSAVQLQGDSADSLTITGSTETENVEIGAGSVSYVRSGSSVTGTGFGSIIANAGSSADNLVVRDSDGDDTLTAWSDRVVVNGGGFFGDARGFGQVVAYSDSGFDRAILHDTAGDEVFNAWADRAVMNGAGFVIDARGFDRVFAYATEGNDQAGLRDSAGNEVFSAWSDRAVMNSSSYVIDARGFDHVIGYASEGVDEARLYDTLGNESFTLWSDRAVMSGSDYTNDLRGFDRVIATASGGTDLAWLHDTAGDEIYTAWWDRTVISGDGFLNDLRGFDQVVGSSTGGNDQARMYDSAGSDIFSAWSDRAVMSGANYLTDLRGFSQVVATATSGNDQARLYDTDGNEFFTAWGDRAVMNGNGFLNDARGFDRVIGYSTGGFDEARMYDTPANDTFLTWSGRAVMRGAGYHNDLRGFDRVIGYGTGGYDYAWMSADLGTNEVTADAIGVALSMSSGSVESRGFERVTAELAALASGSATIEESMDYAFELWGDWS